MIKNPVIHKTPIACLGIVSDDKQVFFFYRHQESKSVRIKVDLSRDAFQFKASDLLSEIKNNNSMAADTKNISDFHISRLNNLYYLSYKKSNSGKIGLGVASSDDLLHWQQCGASSVIKEPAVIIPDYTFRDKYVVLYGDKNISLAYSEDFIKWQPEIKPLITAQQDFFGSSPLKIGSVLLTQNGIFVLYYVMQGKAGSYRYQLRSILLDRKDPTKILEHPEKPIWETPEEWFNKEVIPVGIIQFNNNLISYWETSEGLFAVVHPILVAQREEIRHFHVILKKSEENPIIQPIESHYWESKATFNPGAVYDNDKVHILYRAIGDSDVSVIGYAQSCDGIHIDKRSDEPIYVPREPFESSNPYRPSGYVSPFTSGGGCYGGCEDPRITKIDGKYYMTYVAFDGYSAPKVALTSISIDDFQKGNWSKWKKPVIISKPDVVDKNACILPEKVNDKYVVFHRIFPNILIDYVDSLDFNGKTYLKGEHKIKPRLNAWDSRKVGAGAPPIKTKDGWLMIYQAVGDKDSGKYKMGAMLLDPKDPTNVLYRSEKPILEPNEWYENEGWKAGVAYPCGAVTMDNKLMVYYGGADMVTCVAQAPLDEFLDKLKTNHSAELIPISKQVFTN